jgi:hypothetical protein
MYPIRALYIARRRCNLLPIGINSERTTIEYQLILTAYLVNINNRDACLSCAPPDQVQPFIGLSSMIGG